MIDHFPDMPDDYLIEVGRVCSRWGNLEMVVHFVLAQLCSMNIHDSRALIVFNHMNFQQRMDALGAIIDAMLAANMNTWLEPYKSTVKPLLEKARDGRNTVMHSSWDNDGGIIKIGKIKAKQKLTVSNKPIALSEIRTIAADIYKAAEELHELVLPGWRSQEQAGAQRAVGKQLVGIDALTLAHQPVLLPLLWAPRVHETDDVVAVYYPVTVAQFTHLSPDYASILLP